MRRTGAALLIPALAAAALAGCGGNSPPAGGPGPRVSVTGAFGVSPRISIPARQPGGTLVVQTPIRGTGAAVQPGWTVFANYDVYDWSGTSHHFLSQTFATKTSLVNMPVMLVSNPLPGLRSALVGARVGSRVVAIIPAKDGYGTRGDPVSGIKGGDTLVWVTDILAAFPPGAAAEGKQVSTGGGALPTVKTPAGHAPVIVLPASKPPASLVTKVLIKGNGPTVTTGDTVVSQYIVMDWVTRQVIQSTWLPRQGQPPCPYSFLIDPHAPASTAEWNSGVIGQTVGSRVLRVIPPTAQKPGSNTVGQNSPTSKDTLVYAIDILAASPRVGLGTS